jgi:hypothetical protein
MLTLVLKGVLSSLRSEALTLAGFSCRGKQYELYNINEDIGVEINLTEENPEKLKEQVKELKT